MNVMSTTLQYGDGEEHQLELAGCQRIGPPEGAALDRAAVAEILRAALAKPIDFPPLAAATVPGDHVVVALEQGVPMLAEVIEGLVAALADAGIEPSQTTYVAAQSHSDTGAQLQELADTAGIDLRIHDPSNEEECSLVSITKSGEPLRMNREIGEADLVLPVTLAKGSMGEENQTKFAGLYPEFADGDTISRFQKSLSKQSPRDRKKCQTESDEAGWLLGVAITVRIVPGPSGTVAAIVAGEPSAVANMAAEQYGEVWNQTLGETGELVIATMSQEEGQTWQQLAQALDCAETALRPGGAIVVCSQLAELPGPAVRTLGGNRDYAQLTKSLGRVRAPDKNIALQLCSALDRGAVYLNSHLPSDLVEDLGFTPIESATELQRLTESFENIVVLEDAHKLVLEVTGD